MFIHSIGKRIKDFIGVKVLVKVDKPQELNAEEIDEYTEKEDERVERFHYPNGDIKAERYYHLNKLEGLARYYYPNGAIKAIENYHAGSLEGLSKKYYQSGKIQSEEYYRMGKLISKEEFDESGKLIN